MFGLRRTLLSSDPLVANLRLVTVSEPDMVQHQALDRQVQAFIQARFGQQLDQVIPAGGTRWAFPWIEQELLTHQRVNLRFYDADIASLLEHIEFVAGTWPAEIRSQPNVIAAVIGNALAQTYGLQVGDRLPLSIQKEATRPDLCPAAGNRPQGRYHRLHCQP